MDLVSWLQVLLVCQLGAMSPGPSLALILRNTVRGGKAQGVLTGIGHGLGIYLYAGLVVTGMTLTLTAVPQLELILSICGVVLLIWLGLGSMGLTFKTSKNSEQAQVDQAEQAHQLTGHSGFVTGFLIAFFNPKIAVFFLAIFTPFIQAGSTALDKTIMALTAGTVDTIWYVLVAVVLSGPALKGFLERNTSTIDRVMGVFLLFMAGGLVYRLFV